MKKTVGKQFLKSQNVYLQNTRRHHLLSGTFSTTDYIETNIKTPLNQAIADISQIQTRLTQSENDISTLQTQLTGMQSVFTYENQTRTIFIPNTYTAAQINEAITGIGKFLKADIIITIQFEDSPTKLINTGPAVDYSSGLVGIPVPNHGMSPGDSFAIENTINYDGDYTIHPNSTTNEIVIETTFTAETFTGTEQVRIAQKMEEPLFFQGFSGVEFNVDGSLNDQFQPNSKQKVFLDFSTINDHAIKLDQNIVFLAFRKLKIKFNSKNGYNGIYVVLQHKRCIVFACYIFGNGDSNGACIHFRISFGKSFRSLFSNAKYGIFADQSIQADSTVNNSINILPQYGLYASAGFIFKVSTQPSGSIADELTANGGEIR